MTHPPPSAEDLKRLADTPGAGKAHAEIRRRYDPNFGIPGEAWEVDVAFDGTVAATACATLTVIAETEEDAERIAAQRARAEDTGWCIEPSGYWSDFEPEGAPQIENIKRKPE